jgi:hypothetical protein
VILGGFWEQPVYALRPASPWEVHVIQRTVQPYGYYGIYETAFHDGRNCVEFELYVEDSDFAIVRFRV